MILGSIITSIVGPFANLFGWVLAAFYSFTHSYGLSIVLLTLAVMVVVFPLTRAGTRSMMRMQLLQPELKKIQTKYKAQPGMASEERQALRMKLNEEMMALYRENGVNPTGGCLPMFIQFPIFIVLYDVIRGMTHSITKGTGKHAISVLKPQYIPKHTQLYHAVITSKGVLGFLGINLTDSVRTPGPLIHKIPYVVVILIAVVLQYVSIWQITNRNPSASQINPQMQAVQKFMPLIFVVFYILLPAGVGVYFIVSSLFRVVQQEYMYKHDPMIVELAHSVREMHKKAPITTTAKPGPTGKAVPTAALSPPRPKAPPKKSFTERLRDAAAGFQGNIPNQPSVGELPAEVVGSDAATASNGKPATNSSKNGSPPPSQPAARGPQNRSRAKRPRR